MSMSEFASTSTLDSPSSGLWTMDDQFSNSNRAMICGGKGMNEMGKWKESDRRLQDGWCPAESPLEVALISIF
eukprot:scaffold1999_cov119-Isochrysis_galbana.AAC.4